MWRSLTNLFRIMKPKFFRRYSPDLPVSGLSISAILIFMIIIIGVSGCSYYKVKKSDLENPPSVPELQKLSPEQRYVIIHTGNQMLHLSRVRLNEDEKELSGVMMQLNSAHNYVKPRHKKTYQYNRSEKDPLNEVHFYTSEHLDFKAGEEVAIPFSVLDSVSVNSSNPGRAVLNVAGTTVAVLAVAVVVIALTKSSCPFIYVKDGEEFVFTGELYPGAITPNIQRDDYIPLPDLKPVGDDYIIKITNELHEVQHTDLAQLVVVEHSEEVKVLLDQQGKVQSFADIQPPKKAFSDDLTGALHNILKQDNKSFMFNSEAPADDGPQSLIMEFSKPVGTDKAKLFLKAKNSLWLDYAFGKFNEKFGSYYATFQKQQLKTPAEESIQWAIDQHIPLSIYLKTKKGWELVERLNSVGPLAFRDIVVPIDLKETESDKVVLKLETGFMFWEVDHAGIDFSENADVKETGIEPSFAVDEKGRNVTELLKRTDAKYLTQPEVGNETVVTFRDPSETKNVHKTVFLKNRGYYTYIRNYKGIPNFVELRSFRKKGKFTRFAKEQYDEFVEEKMLDLALTYGN